MILSAVLENPQAYAWSDALFADQVKSLSADTECLVHDPDDIEGEEVDLPNDVIAAGMDYVTSIQIVQSVVENARLQNHANSMDDRLKALNFYLDNDAFIVF